MSEKILVTGGAGYIGSVLTKMLLDEGYEVRILDHFRYNQNSLLDCCYNDNLEIIRGDVRDADVMKHSLENMNYIIHLAALVGFPQCAKNTIGAKTTNLEAVKTLLSLRKSDQKILFPCTNSGYGVEGEDKLCTEETPLNPISLYGRTKVEAEKEILEHGNSITFRLATVFGVSPRMRIDLLVNDFVFRAVRDKYMVLFEGHFKRNFIHVRDVSRAFLHGIKNFDVMKDEPYNVGLSDANFSKIELCEKIKEHLPNFVFMKSEINKDPDQRNYIVSNEKIENTGFKPKYSLDFGIQELLRSYAVLDQPHNSNV